MTPKEKAEELYKKAGSYNKQTIGLSKAVDIALVAVDEVIGVLKYFNEENAYREDITKKYWYDVKRHLKEKLV